VTIRTLDLAAEGRRSRGRAESGISIADG
jgi:hypothetical protein